MSTTTNAGTADEGEGSTSLLPRRAPNGGAAAWARVAAYGSCCLGTLGIQYCFGLLYVELTEALHASQEEIALVGSLSMFLLLLLAPVAKSVVGIIGARMTAFVGGVLASCGFALSAAAVHPWQLCLSYGILVGCGHSLASFAPLSLMSIWFDSRLGLAIASANTATAFAPLVLGPVGPQLLLAIGWRAAFLYLAMFDLCLIGGASVLLTPPATADILRSTTNHATRPPASAVVHELCCMMLKPRVALLGLILLVYGSAAWVPIVHIVKLGLEQSLSKEEASRLLTFLALGNGTLRIPAGYLGDKCGRSVTFCVLVASYAALDVACSFHSAAAASRTFLPGFAYLAGGLTGGLNVLATTLPYDVGLPCAEADLALPLQMPWFGLGIAVGPVAAAAAQSETGNYKAALLGAGGLLFVASILTLVLSLFARRLSLGGQTPTGKSPDFTITLSAIEVNNASSSSSHVVSRARCTGVGGSLVGS
mmetsp:Transcript_84084/g.167827  ORF Transcript_84084/g.167827 Transcript_84084/m.167827 type:complete len:480 (-) Transcript_84084:69-1508(-)